MPSGSRRKPSPGPSRRAPRRLRWRAGLLTGALTLALAPVASSDPLAAGHDMRSALAGATAHAASHGDGGPGGGGGHGGGGQGGGKGGGNGGAQGGGQGDGNGGGQGDGYGHGDGGGYGHGGSNPSPAPVPAPAPAAVPQAAAPTPSAPQAATPGSGGSDHGNPHDRPPGHDEHGNGNSGHGQDSGTGRTSSAPGQSKRASHATSATPTSTAPTATAAAPAVVAPAPTANLTVPAVTSPAATSPAPTSPIRRAGGSGRSRRSRTGPTPRRSSSQPQSRGTVRRRAPASGRRSLTASRGLAGQGSGTRARGTTRFASLRAPAGGPAAGSSSLAGLHGGLRGARRVQYLNRSSLAGLTAHRSAFVPALIGNLVPLPVPDWSKPIILALLLFCLVLAVRAWHTSRRASRLESQRSELAADLESMQAALVPAIPSRLGTLGVSVAYRPADGPAAGGDFYDAFALDGGRVAVIVGDVSGHGRNALARAAHMHYALRAYVETGLDPRSSLKLAGRVLGTDGDGLFTTVAIAVYDPDLATLTYATAGHPAPVVLGEGAVEPVYGPASPALGWGLPTGLRQTVLPFPAGTRACFFSDGVTEARTPEGLLGRERLAELLSQSGGGASAAVLLERVRANAATVTDDMAACVIEASTGTPLYGLRIEELEADPDQLSTGQGARFLSACGVAAADIEPTLSHAREVAAGLGSAILRVQQTAAGATVSVDGATSLVLGMPAFAAASTANAVEDAGADAGSGQWAGRALPLRSQ